MRNGLKGFAIGLAAVAAMGLATPSVAETVLRIGTVLAPNDPMGQGLEKFKTEVEAATGGEVVVEVFHNSQLGDTTEMIDQARAGGNVGTVTDVARLSSFVPSLAIMSAPFLFDTYEEADKFALSDAYLGWGDELKEKAGLVMLASNWYQGARHALTQKPISGPGGSRPVCGCAPSARRSGSRRSAPWGPSRRRSRGARSIPPCSSAPSTPPRRSRRRSGAPSSTR